jgi:putative transposase
MDFTSHHHCIFNLKYHLVLVTKYRRKCLSEPVREALKGIIETAMEKWNVDLIEYGGEEDHIHLLYAGHPNLQMSRFIGNLKTVSSRHIRKQFPDHFKQFYWTPVLWTRAYCLLSTGGATIDTIKQYIENQGVDRRFKTKKERHSSPPKTSL